MKLDVFLYGRTITHDYFDMYLPPWLKTDTDEYREYRKTISHIMKIRDNLHENEMDILKETADSFIFYKGRKTSMLCTFCHITGYDQFDRPICSAEGFIFRQDELNSLWKYIPDMIAYLSGTEETYYKKYISLHGEETRPETENHTENIIFENIAEPELEQFKKLKEAVQNCSRPFSFAYGRFGRKLYDYSPDDAQNRTDVFFVSDECTDIKYDEVSVKKEANLGEMKFYAEIKKSSRERIRYKAVLCDESGEKVYYESYEKEAGAEIKISEIFRMAETVREYIAEHGKDENALRKCVPFSSDSDFIYEGRKAVIEYRPPAEQKRSLLQIIKGVKTPDFSEYLFLRSEENDKKLAEICKISASQSDPDVRLVSYSDLMEGIS